MKKIGLRSEKLDKILGVCRCELGGHESLGYSDIDKKTITPTKFVKAKDYLEKPESSKEGVSSHISEKL
ncbi:hypothetical protein Gotur_000197 [Gossypium turneri]